MGTDDAKLAGLGNEKGMVLVMVTLLLALLLGFVGLVVDGGIMQVVRGELQNDADASALAGAVALFPSGGGGGGPLTPQWNVAQATATDFVTKNSSSSYQNGSGVRPLQDGDVTVGYWNLTWTGEHDLTPSTTAPTALTANDIPAVRVKVARAAGSNGGEVPTTFMRVLGINSAAVSSKTSVAVRGYAGSAPPKTLFPMALCTQMATDYFSQNPLPNPPTELTIYSVYHSPTTNTDCQSGQWTSFMDTDNADSTIKKYLDGKNSAPAVNVGDNIYVQNGTETNLFDVTNKDGYQGQDVLMALIDDVNTGSTQKVTGFVTFHIDTATGGSTKTITGHFVNRITTFPGSSSGGSPSNLVSAFPQLVQ